MRNDSVDPNTNINRPLPPHPTIYKPQLTPTFPIFHRIPGAFLATTVLFSLFLCLEMGLVSLTTANLYQFSLPIYSHLSNSPKFTLSVVNPTLSALCHHMGNGVRHLWWDLGFSLESPLNHNNRGIRISEFLMLCVAFSAFGSLIQRIYC
uniref:Succinate dehydrogenase subunit 3 n=1 Tax=Podocarpus macrophyllus TaxID=58043 RepID=A0A6M3X4U2_9CONI|nr:succinate dehydrogenase subunit 3 [Podocarpus macrophyllus]